MAISIFRSLLLAAAFCGSFALAQRTYAPHSVLQTGDWYRVGVVQTGVYRLDRAYLSGLGINVAALDPTTIRVFGNGTGMLPQANAAFRYDDLAENAISVTGEADGTLDGNDAVYFYGQSAHDAWQWDSTSAAFRHRNHLYCDTNYYYINVGQAKGKRIQAAQTSMLPVSVPAEVRGTAYWEIDQQNLINSGRQWVGDLYDFYTTRKYSYYLPDIADNGQVRLWLRFAARASNQTSFTIKVNGVQVGSRTMETVNLDNDEGFYFRFSESRLTVPANTLGDDSLRIEISYNKGGVFESKGWLDWIEIDYDHSADALNRDYCAFRLLKNSSAVADLSVANFSAAHSLWDVTNPTDVRIQNGTQSGTTRFANGIIADRPRSFVAHKGGYLSPAVSRKIANQDLHGLGLYDYLIITHPAFMEQAKRLADFHREKLNHTPVIVTPQQIYQEFSAGKRDVSAIRDFVKMFYDRSNGVLHPNVLLFGDGTYDPREINPATRGRNYIPTYQSRVSNLPASAFTSDDFYGILDDNEGFWGESSGFEGDTKIDIDQIDAAVGRLPVESIEEATAMVDKIIQYVKDANSVGAWRNTIALVADHKDTDGSTHAIQADGLSTLLNNSAPCYNTEKLYMDNYPMELSPGGYSFPLGRNALLDVMDKGSLILNYVGHGKEDAWSNGRIFGNGDIARIKNGGHTPVYITATCEYGRYDNPSIRTGAELLTVQPNGGAIALYTSVRLVYSSANELFNRRLYQQFFKFDSDAGRMPTLGEVMYRAKNTIYSGTGSNINTRNFSLLGDPGLTMAYPDNQIVLTQINGANVNPSTPITFASASKVSAKGKIVSNSGNQLSDFQGKARITVFDKPSAYTTIRSPFTFYWQNSRIFSGESTVKNGEFSFDFIVPIDVSYESGYGKFSIYAYDSLIDAGGCLANATFGGTDTTATADTDGPQVQLFINDENWRDGGYTNPEPYLYAKISDKSGVNTIASSIGHEIIATLENGAKLVLNDYYAAKTDSYTEGTVRYQLREVKSGTHTVSLRVWDVLNNFTDAQTSFIIADNAALALTEVLNFPNPVNGSGTNFLIGYNQTDKELQVEVRIFDINGREITTLGTRFFASGNYFQDLHWDGTSNGAPVAEGVYTYRVTLSDPAANGKPVHTFEKLVVIR